MKDDEFAKTRRYFLVQGQVMTRSKEMYPCVRVAATRQTRRGSTVWPIVRSYGVALKYSHNKYGEYSHIGAQE